MQGLRLGILLALVVGLPPGMSSAALPSAKVREKPRSVFSPAKTHSIVRVRLGTNLPEFSFQSKGLRIRDRDGRGWSVATGAEVTIRYLQDPGVLEVFSTLQGPGKETRREFYRPPLDIQSRSIQSGKNHYPPHLSVQMVSGRIQVVGRVPLDDYLLGVLSREMPSAWPVEARKAQAVAARSYTLARLKERSAESFDVEDSILDQEFRWVERRNHPTYRRWREVIEATRSWVLLAPSGEILKAYYHADCGGRTTTSRQVWGTNEAYRPVRDPFCERRGTNLWRLEVEKDELWRSLLQSWSDPVQETPSKGEDFQLFTVRSPEDGRVSLVEWARENTADARILTGQSFRELLGFSLLKSTRFAAREEGNRFVFIGKGKGHGVGLCQWGARDWALVGRKAPQILSHYYPLARLRAR